MNPITRRAPKNESNRSRKFTCMELTPEELVDRYKSSNGSEKRLYENEAFRSIAGLIIKTAANYRRHFLINIDPEIPVKILPEPGDVLSEVFIYVDRYHVFDRFDTTLGFRLSTYLKLWVKKAFYALLKKEREINRQKFDLYEKEDETPESILLQKERDVHIKQAADLIEKIIFSSSSRNIGEFKSVYTSIFTNQNLKSDGTPHIQSLSLKKGIKKSTLSYRLASAKNLFKRRLAKDLQILDLLDIANSDESHLAEKTNLYANLAVRTLSEEEHKLLDKMATSICESSFSKRRAKILLLSAKGLNLSAICDELELVTATAKKAIEDFNTYGLECLISKHKSRKKSEDKGNNMDTAMHSAQNHSLRSHI